MYICLSIYWIAGLKKWRFGLQMAAEAKDADLLASRLAGEVLQATVQDLQAEIAKLETRQYPLPH